MNPAITQIDVDHFEEMGAERNPMALHHVEELEFFSVLGGWYLGVLIRDRYDNDYSFAVLGPDPNGAQRWIGGGDSIKSIDEARTQLFARLLVALEGGKQVHVQD